MRPLPYAPDVETVSEDEAHLTDQIVEQMAAANRCAFERHRHAVRDAHAKSNGLLIGELAVHANLPPELRQGIFAEARSYHVVARLSSAPGSFSVYCTANWMSMMFSSSVSISASCGCLLRTFAR